MIPLIKVVEVKALPDFKLWAKFSDGVDGVVDLSKWIGIGVFKIWEQPGVFENVKPRGSGIQWTEDLDIDAFNVYLTITNQTIEEYDAKYRGN